MSPQNIQERKAKLDENVKNMAHTFKKLRLVYDKVQEKVNSLPVDATDPEVIDRLIHSLL